MIRAFHFAVALAIACLLTSPASADDITIPYLTGRVVDDANVLSQAARDRITAASKAHEASTMDQIVVLTVPSLGGVSVEEYAVKVFEAWKLGQKGRSNGVLVVVAPREHRVRIEVGYGLEATLPDGAAGNIIRTWMAPAFQTGNFDKGVEDGVAAIIAKLEGRTNVPGRAFAAAPSGSTSRTPPSSGQVVGGILVFMALGVFTIVALIVAEYGWFLYVFLIPFWAFFPAAFIGWATAKWLLLIYAVGFPIAKLMLSDSDLLENTAAESSTRSRSESSSSFFSSTSSSDDSWSSDSSSSSSSDSFSGGGGDSGGGGASGSW